MKIIETNDLRGSVHKYGDDINTDYIIPGKYLMNILDDAKLAQHAMEGVDPDFYQSVEEGDFVVGGRNFGCGSSREEAPVVLKEAGVGAVLAQSFARIFYRNAINIGLPILECDTTGMEEGDELRVDFEGGEVENLTKGEIIQATSLPQAMRDIIADGGLVAHIKKHGSFQI